MIAVDTNVLVYAHREEAPGHEVAARTTEAAASGNLVFDAQIVALCREHGARLLTADRDFDRFHDFPVIRFGAG